MGIVNGMLASGRLAPLEDAGEQKAADDTAMMNAAPGSEQAKSVDPKLNETTVATPSDQHCTCPCECSALNASPDTKEKFWGDTTSWALIVVFGVITAAVILAIVVYVRSRREQEKRILGMRARGEFVPPSWT